jgi:hypothetical protein
MLTHQRNPARRQDVVLYMNPINEVHVQEPGLAVVDITAADAATALALQEALAAQWATATVSRATRASPVYGCAATWICASRSARRPRSGP